jgi:hypothetical protein
MKYFVKQNKIILQPTTVFKPKPLRFLPLSPKEVDNDSEVEGETN